MHILYQISRVSRFWVRAKSVAVRLLTAGPHKAGAINRTCGYFNSYPNLNCSIFIYTVGKAEKNLNNDLSLRFAHS